MDVYIEMKAELESMKRWIAWFELKAEGNEVLMLRINKQKARAREMEERLDFLHILEMVFLGE